MSYTDIIQIIILLILIYLSSFFSSSETALTSMSQVRMRVLAEEGRKNADKVLKITENSSKMLSTVLICNNVVNISATSLTTVIAIRLFGNAYVAAATAILTLLIILFGEIMPKSMAQAEADDMSLRCAPVIGFLMTVLTPVIALVDFLSRGLLHLVGVDPDARPVMTENELRTLVSDSERDGVIEEDERSMINNVVDLMSTVAQEIMIPRIDMSAVPEDISYDELIEQFRKERFTRLPVYRESPDDVIGILNIKDLLLTTRETFSVTAMMTEPYFTYEQKNLSDLLDEMRLNSQSIVIVLDEYGAVSGMITMEDVLEEIVGDIHDEYSGRDAEEITTLTPGREYSCVGSANLDDVNEKTGLTLSSEDYDTIGGYVIEHSEDTLPKVGEYVITEDGARLIVEAVRRNRILRVHIYLPSEGSSTGNKEDGTVA